MFHQAIHHMFVFYFLTLYMRFNTVIAPALSHFKHPH
jgi:hypothetical protein